MVSNTSLFRAEKQFVVIVLLISSLLNIGYLLPLVARGFFLKPDTETENKRFSEPNLLVWLPPAITAAISFLLFFYMDYIRNFTVEFGLVN